MAQEAPKDMKTIKRSLRKAFNKVLQAVPTVEIDRQSEAVARHLSKDPIFARSRSVFCYLSMKGGELQTGSIVSQCFRGGKTLYVPKVAGGRQMGVLSVPSAERVESFGKTKWGIPEPNWPDDLLASVEASRKSRWAEAIDFASCGIEAEGVVRQTKVGPAAEHTQSKLESTDKLKPMPLDLVLLPCVAMDRSFGRLGHGGGFYDTFLARIDRAHEEAGLPRPVRMAVCLREQLLPLRGDTLLATDRAGSSGAPSEGTASSASASSATPAAATAACPATGTGTTSSSSTTSDVEGARELLRATEHVPMGEHDQPVDFIVTPDGVLSRESESPRGATASASGGAAGSLPVGGAASGGYAVSGRAVVSGSAGGPGPDGSADGPHIGR